MRVNEGQYFEQACLCFGERSPRRQPIKRNIVRDDQSGLIWQGMAVALIADDVRI
jgi:hypothetical protein